MVMLMAKVFASTLAGTLTASIIGCFPALHVYNVAMLFVAMHATVARSALGNDPYVVLPFMMGMVVGWALMNTVPAVFLGAPDESAMLMVMPTQRYLMQGRGYEAAMLTAIGGLGGLICLLAVAPLLPRAVPMLRTVLNPHLFWLLMLVVAYMVLSEFPKGGDHGPSRSARLLGAWIQLGAGMLTLVLSAWLGFILLRKAPLDTPFEFSKITPAFVGLFAVPWVLQNVMSGTTPPRQFTPASVDCPGTAAFSGISAGFLGGFFAAFMPLVTGGIGGLLAGHATAQNDDRSFIVSQGTSKFVYYVGSFLLFFVPAASKTRGGLATMLRTIYMPRGLGDYLMVIASMAIAGAAAFLLMGGCARAVIWLIQRVDYRLLSYMALGIMAVLVFAMAGWMGMFILLVSAGIGMLPVVFFSRRSNCMGILLIPVTLDMAGYGPAIAQFLGLQ